MYSRSEAKGTIACSMPQAWGFGVSRIEIYVSFSSKCVKLIVITLRSEEVIEFSASEVSTSS